MNEDKMSRTQAAFFLSEMARDAASETQITALRVACRALLKRHFDHMDLNLRRRARKADCQPSANPAGNGQELAKPEPAKRQASAKPPVFCQILARGLGVRVIAAVEAAE